MQIPQSVIETDHDLEATEAAAEAALAEHRWHQTLDPDGPGHTIAKYARAIGRNWATVAKYAKGYAAWLDQDGLTRGKTLADAIELANLSAEKQEVAQAVAEVEGVSVKNITNRRGTGDSLANVTEQARDAAERKGTTVADEARDIAERRKKTREMEKTKTQAAKAKRGRAFMQIEGKVARAKSLLADALKDAEGAGLDGEELELLRSTIESTKSVLTLLDLRVGGDPDIDWDAELEKIGAPS